MTEGGVSWMCGKFDVADGATVGRVARRGRVVREGAGMHCSKGGVGIGVVSWGKVRDETAVV